MMKTLILSLLIVLGLTQTQAFANRPQVPVETLIANLSSRDEDTRQDAVRALTAREHRNNNDIIAPLTLVLRRDPSNYTRELAAEALMVNENQAGQAAVIETLSHALYGNGHEAAARALRRTTSDAAKAPLVQALSSSNEDVRAYSAQALRNFLSDSEVVTKLTRSLNQDREGRVREHAAESLAKLPAAQAVSIFSQTLSNPRSSGREAAVRGLGDIRDPSAVAPLLTVINDPSSDIRRQALSSLSGHAKRADVFEAVYARFQREPDQYTKERQFELLVKNSDPRVLTLARQLINSSNRFLRQEAIELIGKRGNKNDLVDLIGQFSHENEQIRLKAFNAIRAIIARLEQDHPLRTQIAGCLPQSSQHEYSRETRQTALLLDIFLGTAGLLTASAHSKYRVVERLSPARVRALQDVVRELVRDSEIAPTASESPSIE